MKLMSTVKLVIVFSVMILLSVPPQSHSAQEDTEIAASCAGSGAGGPGAYLACVLQGQGMKELKSCLTGGPCIGSGHTIFGCDGLVRSKWLGHKCSDALGAGYITIVNENSYPIRFYFSSAHGPTNTVDIQAGTFFVTAFTMVNYRMNFPNGADDAHRDDVIGHRLTNGSTYRFVGTQSRPQLTCVRANGVTNDSANPCG